MILQAIIPVIQPIKNKQPCRHILVDRISRPNRNRTAFPLG